MSNVTLPSSEGFDPGSMSAASLSTAKPLWYRRPWVMITGAVVVVVALSVLSDLPAHVTAAQDAAAQTSSLHEINGDLAPCDYAIQESLTILQGRLDGTLSSSEKSQIPTLLKNDQTACSFTSSSIFDLTNNVQIQGTAAGHHVNAALSDATIWATGDALALIDDVSTLYSDPTNATARRDLDQQMRMLDEDRTKARAEITAAIGLLGLTIPMPNLPALHPVTFPS